jgi:hypothetical protein
MFYAVLMFCRQALQKSRAKKAAFPPLIRLSG